MSKRKNGRKRKPHYDKDRRELRLGEEVVKQFKQRAPNQEAVLLALQEDGWPPRIDDPQPPKDGLDAKRRLHDTINNLNRHQKTARIHFYADGRGEGVLWELP